MIKNQTEITKTCFFASDVHIGLDKDPTKRERAETIFISWLEMVEKEQGVLFLLGDIFDFWFEYKNTIPNGYGRVLSKLTTMCSNGIQIHFFKGNHDMWTRGYLEKEVGMIIHNEPELFQIQGKSVVMGHGHNLTTQTSNSISCDKSKDEDRIKTPLSYRFMLWVFTNPVVFSIVSTIMHPDLMMWFGRKWSRGSRKSKSISHEFLYEDEFIVNYCNNACKRGFEADYFVFGHIHCCNRYTLAKHPNSTLFTLGHWIGSPQFAVMQNGEMKMNCK